jgi:hypothetical protein
MLKIHPSFRIPISLSVLVFGIISCTIPGGANHTDDTTDHPDIGLILPVAGHMDGGDSITIYGINFTGATKVSFGGVDAASFVIDSPVTITCVVPAHAAGVVDVTVHRYNETGTLSSGYTYINPGIFLISEANLQSPDATSITAGTT